MQAFVNKIFTILLLVFATSFAQAAPWGTVHGHKFNDLNGNGADNSEPRLAGFKIVIQGTGGIPYLANDTTDAQGRYHFTNLPFQTYVICEIIPPDSVWIATTPLCANIVLTPKDSSDMMIFGNKRREQTDLGCTRTQGFWGSSPQGQLLLKNLVPAPSTMLLGTNSYTAIQLDNILDVPVAGNALLILTHQLIAAKANILAGANISPIGLTIANSDAAIGALLIPPIGAAFVAPASAQGVVMTALASDLDKYNNGLAGVPHCD